MAEFTSYLKEYRIRAGLTQEELAVKVNVRRETIIRLEAGKYNPSLKLAIDISLALKTPIEDLFVFNLPATGISHEHGFLFGLSFLA